MLTPTAIALGNFDGIHIGHQKVISSITTDKVEVYPHCHSTVVTFNPHPQEFFSGQKKQCLTPLPEKVKWLEKMGIEQLVLLPFNQELSYLSPQQFVEQIIVQKLQAMRVSVGEDFRFGYRRKGDVEDLKAIASGFGIEVIITSLQNCQTQGVRVSSSRIRQALAEGDISEANRMLGRSYSLTGKVIAGQQLGRTIGFPTANLQLSADKLLPRYGVYCVRVEIEDDQTEINPQIGLNGVMNIGCRPTVEGDRPTVEVHLLDWSGDLYGRGLIVHLEKFLRAEQKFPSLDALKERIQADCDLAKTILQV